MQKVVILDRALSNNDVSDILRKNNFLIRFSNSVISYTCIFPTSSVAFLLIFKDQLLSSSSSVDCKFDPKLMDDIHRFNKLHKMCYAILEQPPSSLHGGQQQQLSKQEELVKRDKVKNPVVDLVNSLQKKYLSGRLQFIPVPNIKTMVQVMINIDTLRRKTSVNILSERIKKFLDLLIGNTDMAEAVLSTLLTDSEINWVQDDVSSLRNLITMRSQELLGFGLSSDVIAKIISFFA